MKTRFLLILLVLNFSNFVGQAQNNYALIPLKNFKNQTTNLLELAENEQIVVLSFWATWCKPCISELNTISEEIENWQNEVKFSFIAISIDDSRSSSKVKSLANGSAWDFKIALDQNQELKRNFGVKNIPFTVVLKNGEVVYQHSGYLPGDENILWAEIQKLNE